MMCATAVKVGWGVHVSLIIPERTTNRPGLRSVCSKSTNSLIRAWGVIWISFVLFVVHLIMLCNG